jgi:hypothetical protein
MDAALDDRGETTAGMDALDRLGNGATMGS